ncbi:TonB-dependent receptor [Novosphingobium sp. B 225]|uniref:TonB-dependent receptor n=1 Tax=Novosphingobium sp. B 225 TaxID=1961849 RepID=UPI000B4BC037|nr:TonB-dependent receptor [Novosphingobium sp. B 225]
MTKLCTRFGIGASTLAMALSAAPAFAQEADAKDTADTEIVVTAQFREQKLQDTPIAITAVNAEMLERRGQTDITQVAAQAPNVTLRPQPQNGGSGLIAFIRGVGQTDFNYALDPGVGVYIDDVYIPTLSSSLLELMDLDRIEILRGPQGTLAGKNSIGGAIKLFSTKPKGDNSGSLSVSYGSYKSLNIRGMADLKLSENLAVRLSGMARSNDGYVGMLDYGLTHPTSNVPANLARGSGNGDYSTMGGQNVTAIRGALRWTPTSTVEVNISGDYTRENSEAIPTVLIAAGAVAPAGTTFNPNSVANSASFTGTGLNPWLVGKNGAQVNMSCAFVPAGPYSCDTGGNLLGWDPRFVSYSNFLDNTRPTAQAPYKPYYAMPVTKFNGWGVHGSLKFDLSDSVNLLYIGSYRAYESKFGQDQDATPIPIAQLDNQLNHHAWSSELRLNFKAGDGLVEGTVGGFYLKQKGTYTARVDLNYVTPVIDFIHGPDTTPSSTKALFATATFHPTEAMSITGGVRYTKDQKDYTYFRSNPDGTIPNGFKCFVTNGVFSEPNCILAGIYNVTGTFKGNRWDWRGVVDYRFSREFLAYASVSTGFKGGGVNPRPFVSDQALSFNPETLTTYEVGFKADLLDRRIRLNGAGFINKYSDITLGKQVCPESSLPTPCLRPANIGSADVKGFEFETTIRPVEGFTLDGSFSYLDFKYTTPSAAGLLVGTGIPANGITPYTPKTAYSVGAQYDHEMTSGTVTLRLDGAYQSAIYTSSENTVWSRIPGRFISNGQLSFTSADKAWKATLEVKNLFDKYYYMSVSDVTTALGAVTGVPGLPRTWQVSLKRTF